MNGLHFRRVRVLVAALLLSVLFSGVITPAYAETYGFILKWGSYGTGDGQFNHPMGVAIDASGNVYVADAGNDRVQKFTGDGVFITKWGSEGSGDGQFNYPNGVAVDASGNVYVVDSFNDRVQKFTGDGVFITKWGSWGSGDGQFDYATGVAVDASGNVYVADSHNNRVQKFTGDGVFITKWGYDQAFGPWDVAVDALGNVYVADSFNDRVQKFGPGPAYTLTITATTGGTTNPSPGSYTCANGTVAVVSATPYTDCFFDYWELDGINVGSINPISVTMNADHTLHAVFIYDVIIDAYCYTEDAHVSVSITMDGISTGYNTPHTFTGLTGTHTFTIPSTDANGHPFQQWSTRATSTTITVSSGGTYTAYYGVKYTLTITTTTGGTTSPSPGTHTYWSGTVISVTATPYTDYAFNHWELDGDNVGATNPISVTMDQDHSLHAVFVYTPPPPVPEFPSADISIVAATLAFVAALYLILKGKKPPTPKQV